jgi:hypothetical protein
MVRAEVWSILEVGVVGTFDAFERGVHPDLDDIMVNT